MQQYAFHEVDTFCSLKKQNIMLTVVLDFYDQGIKALKAGVYLKELADLPVRDKIARMKYIPEENISEIADIKNELAESINQLISKGGILDA